MKIKWIAFFALILFAQSNTAFSEVVVERILAVVNDEVVTDQDLQTSMAPIIAQYKTNYSGKEYEEKIAQARQEFLLKMIDDKLILSEAKKKQVIVKDEEVEEMLTDVRNKFPSREQFLSTLLDQGLSEKKLWARFHDQLMTQKLVGAEVRAKVQVSPGEVNEYYKAHQQEFIQGDRVKLQHILIRSKSRGEDEAKVLAVDLVAKLRNGASFDELAKQYSEGSEASEGGMMGWVEKGQLMGEIDDKVFALNEGQITGVVQSSLGFHIFKILERDKQSVKPLAEVRAQVYDAIFKEKLKVRLEAWIANLKKNAYISIR